MLTARGRLRAESGGARTCALHGGAGKGFMGVAAWGGDPTQPPAGLMVAAWMHAAKRPRLVRVVRVTAGDALGRVVSYIRDAAFAVPGRTAPRSSHAKQPNPRGRRRGLRATAVRAECGPAAAGARRERRQRPHPPRAV